MRLARHVEEPLIAEEADPGLALRVRLVEAADQGVAREAEARRGDPVQVGQELGGVALRRSVQRVARLDVVHEQQLVRGVHHARHRQPAVSLEIVEHEALEGEAAPRGPELGDEVGTVLEAHAVDLADAAAGERQKPHRLAPGVAGDGGEHCVPAAAHRFAAADFR